MWLNPICDKYEVNFQLENAADRSSSQSLGHNYKKSILFKYVNCFEEHEIFIKHFLTFGRNFL